MCTDMVLLHLCTGFSEGIKLMKQSPFIHNRNFHMKARILFIFLLIEVNFNPLKSQTLLDTCLTDSLPILTISSQWAIISNSLSQGATRF